MRPRLLELPTDKPRPPVQGHRGASVPVRLPSATWEALKALARREGVTPFMLLLAAFQVLLHRHSGQEDISVGTPIAGRTRAETQGLIGLFVNTLVLRTHLGGNPSFRQLLQRVRDTTLGAYAHQDVPFEKLVEELRPVRHLSHSPLFQVMLVLQPDPLPGFTLPGLTLSHVELESRTSKFDLTLSLSESAQGLAGHAGVRHRPLRALHRGAPGGPPAPVAGGCARPARAAPLRAAPAHRRRAPAGAARSGTTPTRTLPWTPASTTSSRPRFSAPRTPVPSGWASSP